MNRVLKRPMFRIGGSAGTGITSGLDQPRKQYQEGTPNPYAINLMPGTLPGFLTSFGLNLLSTPPQGGLLQTAATAAREPFDRFQAAELRRGEIEGEREFKRELLETELAAKKEIAGMEGSPLYKATVEKYLEDDLPPLAAERAAKFETEDADALRTQVTGPRYGGVLPFDVRDKNIVESSAGKKALAKLDGKFVYDPFEDNYKFIKIINGVEYFDEFKTIAEVKLPEPKTKQQEEVDELVPSDFGLSIDDPSA